MTATDAVTVWRRGRLDARAAPSEVLFGRMYEDASIELDAFPRGGRVFCIASAGCTAMTLAPHHEVVAVDINPNQVAYARRRFQGGPGVHGRAERVMGVARFFGPLVGWWPSKVRAFLELDDVAAQTEYWHAHLDTWRLRRAFDLLFSVKVLGAAYASPFLELLPDRLGTVMRSRMERCFALHPNRDNPYARALLLGELSSDVPPPEAQDIHLVNADAAAFLEEEPPGSFDALTLSNILDGTDAAYRERLFAAVTHAAAPGAIVVLRSFSDAGTDPRTNRAADDRAMLWGRVTVSPVEELGDSCL